MNTGAKGSEMNAQGVTSLTAAAHELKSPLALVRQLALRLDAGDVSYQ